MFSNETSSQSFLIFVDYFAAVQDSYFRILNILKCLIVPGYFSFNERTLHLLLKTYKNLLYICCIVVIVYPAIDRINVLGVR